ncbi:hypothetical protein D5272_07055 [bacterium D16-76]|nr:hypothetical protein [bacterium D16-76]
MPPFRGCLKRSFSARHKGVGAKICVFLLTGKKDFRDMAEPPAEWASPDAAALLGLHGRLTKKQ